MKKIVGFIGCGNMSQAMIGGIINSRLIGASSIIGSPKKEDVENKWGITTTKDNREVAKVSDYLIIGVKPHLYEMIIGEVRDHIKKGAVVISIGAGISSKFLAEKLGEDILFIKTMPNTPAMVGEAMTAISPVENFPEDKLEEIKKIFSSFGRVEVIEERLMDAFTAVAGSSPAYIYILIEAMADAAVSNGMPRNKAYKIVAQSLLGSAKMVLDTSSHPAQLKDNVCSPGGTTIEGVKALEEYGFRNSIIRTVDRVVEKSKYMSKD